MTLLTHTINLLHDLLLSNLSSLMNHQIIQDHQPQISTGHHYEIIHSNI